MISVVGVAGAPVLPAVRSTGQFCGQTVQPRSSSHAASARRASSPDLVQLQIARISGVVYAAQSNYALRDPLRARLQLGCHARIQDRLPQHAAQAPALAVTLDDARTLLLAGSAHAGAESFTARSSQSSGPASEVRLTSASSGRYSQVQEAIHQRAARWPPTTIARACPSADRAAPSPLLAASARHASRSSSGPLQQRQVPVEILGGHRHGVGREEGAWIRRRAAALSAAHVEWAVHRRECTRRGRAQPGIVGWDGRAQVCNDASG